MSELIKIKQIENLASELASKALDSAVVKTANNLSDVNASTARTNLNLYSKSEVDAMVVGAKNAFNVADLTARGALTGIKVTDRIFVNNDGDGKWALYIVTAVTNGSGSTSTYKKIADEDLFSNALTAEAVKSAYESNADTNAYTNAAKGKVDKITIATNINIDTVKSTADSALADAATAQSTANSASSAAAAAQNTANSANSAASAAQNTANNAANAASNAQATADSKEDAFSQTTENFTNINGAADQDINIALSNPVKDGFALNLYFNGVHVKVVNFSPGSNNITFRVPYTTETSDQISVTYTS